MIFVGNIYSGLSSSGGGGGVMTLDNGLTLTGTNGQLGGILLADTTIETTPAYILNLGDTMTANALIVINPVISEIQVFTENVAGTVTAALYLKPTYGFQLRFTDGGVQQLSGNGSGGVIVEDGINNLGLIGFADYTPAAKTTPFAYAQYNALGAFLTGSLINNVVVDNHSLYSLFLGDTVHDQASVLIDPVNAHINLNTQNNHGSSGAFFDLQFQFRLGYIDTRGGQYIKGNGSGGINIIDEISHIGLEKDASVLVATQLANPNAYVTTDCLPGGGLPVPGILGNINARLQTALNTTFTVATINATKNQLVRLNAALFLNTLGITTAITLAFIYTDEGGTVRTLTQTVISTLAPPQYPPQVFYCQKNTPVQISVALNIAGASYNLYAALEYLNVQN